MKRLLLALLTFVAVAVCIPAQAALSKSSGFYADPGLGIGFIDSDLKVGNKELSHYGAASFDMGYQFMYQAAVEVGGVYYPDHNYKGGKQTRDNFGTYAGLKLIKSFLNGATLFAKGGYGYAYTRVKNSKARNGKIRNQTWFVGGGTSLFIDQNVGFTLQVLSSFVSKDIPARYIVTTGFTYIF